MIDHVHFRFTRTAPEHAAFWGHLDKWREKSKAYYDFAAATAKDLGVPNVEQYGLHCVTGDGCVEKVPVISIAFYCREAKDFDILLAAFPPKTFVSGRSRDDRYTYQACFRKRSKPQKYVETKAKEAGLIGVIPSWPGSLNRLRPASVPDSFEFIETHPGVYVITQDDLILYVTKDRTGWASLLSALGGQPMSLVQVATLLESRVEA